MREFSWPLVIVTVFAWTECHLATAQSTDTPNSPSTERGTLGLLVFTKFGIVIAADSRSTAEDGSFDDHANKIFQLSDASACMIAGQVRDQRRFFGKIMGFNFPMKIQQHAQQTHAQFDAGPFGVRNEAKLLGELLSNDLFDVGFLHAPSPLDDGATISSIVVAGYSKTLAGPGIPEHVVAEGYKLNIVLQTEGTGQYSPGEPSVIRSYWVVGAERAPFAPFALFTNGNNILIKPTLETTKKDWLLFTDKPETVDLQSIRANPAVKKYLDLKDSGQLDSMSLEQAVDFATALLNENIRVAGRQLGIGGQVDVATITPHKGFKWVPGHEPERKRQQ